MSIPRRLKSGTTKWNLCIFLSSIMNTRRKSVALQIPDFSKGSKAKDKDEVSIWTIVSTGNAEGLRQFIKANGHASLSKRTGNFRSPLGLAVYLENPELVQIMLECDPKPDVNIADKNGNTPLHEAVERGYLQIVKQLVNTGTLFLSFILFFYLSPPHPLVYIYMCIASLWPKVYICYTNKLEISIYKEVLM